MPRRRIHPRLSHANVSEAPEHTGPGIRAYRREQRRLPRQRRSAQLAEEHRDLRQHEARHAQGGRRGAHRSGFNLID